MDIIKPYINTNFPIGITSHYKQLLLHPNGMYDSDICQRIQSYYSIKKLYTYIFKNKNKFCKIAYFGTL